MERNDCKICYKPTFSSQSRQFSHINPNIWVNSLQCLTANRKFDLLLIVNILSFSMKSSNNNFKEKQQAIVHKTEYSED